MSYKHPFLIINESHAKITTLVRSRLPWLLVGLVGGTLATFMVSSFEKVLQADIRLAFFVPMIVYMSDAVGTQTETMYVRTLSEGKSNFLSYLFKEFGTGVYLGLILGLLIGGISFLWLQSVQIALTVGLAMFVNIAVAPVVALIVPSVLSKEHMDPALGAGPFTTVIQDFISLLLYFLISSMVLSIYVLSN